MAKLEVNAIFYSKQNLNAAYELKRACREVGVSLIYAFEIPELVRFLNEVKVGIIFIDSATLASNEHIIGFIKTYTNCKNSIIICLKTSDQHLELPSSVNYVIHSSSLLTDLKAIENEIVNVINNQNNVEYNSNEVNTFLSNYLINIGLAPKHIGFVYIKQVIELALKHGAIGSLSKDIYPTIASKNKTFSQNVERNIRNAIECACKTNELKKDSIHVLLLNEKISNRAFLCYLLDKVQNTNFQKKQIM